MVPLLRSSPPQPESWRQAYLLEHVEEEPRRHSSEGSERLPPRLRTLEPPDPQTRVLRTHWTLPEIPSFRGLRLRDEVYVEYETGERELYDQSRPQV